MQGTGHEYSYLTLSFYITQAVVDLHHYLTTKKKKKLKIMEFYEQFIAKEISPIVGFKKGSQLPPPHFPLFFFNQHLIQNWNPVKNSG